MNLKRVRRRIRKWAYGSNSPVIKARRERMREMIKLLKVPSGARILDLGGTEAIWNLVDYELEVTLLNVRHPPKENRNCQNFRYVEGDACDLHGEFESQSFDVVFSNSVIEHVGPEPRQESFASEVRRLGRGYWVQTPSSKSPIEPHTWCPFFWQVKRLVGKELLYKGNTRVLTRARMQKLFPDGHVFVERLLGVEKSYVLYKPQVEGS